MNFRSGQELKKARTSVSTFLISKITGVGDNTARACIKTVSQATKIISTCFIRPGCSVVALQTLSFCLPNHLYLSDFLHVARNLLYLGSVYFNFSNDFRFNTKKGFSNECNSPATQGRFPYTAA